MKATIKINGMHCNSCAMLLTDVLGDMDGVKEASVSLEKKEAHVDFDPAKVKEADMRKAIEAEGYKTA